MKRLLLFFFWLGLFLILTLPAWLLDSAIQRATQGRLRLAEPFGSVWTGSGTLARQSGTRTLTPWLPLKWTFQPSALLQAHLRWVFYSAEQTVFTFSIAPSGIQVETVALTLPARALGDVVPHPVFQAAGWRGNLSAKTPQFACTWRQRCTGHLQLDWQDAGVDILPTQRFGHFSIAVDAQNGDFSVQVTSPSHNEIQAQGRGHATFKGPFQFEGTLTGDPNVVERLPNIMDKNARLTGQSGVVALHFP